MLQDACGGAAVRIPAGHVHAAKVNIYLNCSSLFPHETRAEAEYNYKVHLIRFAFGEKRPAVLRSVGKEHF